MVSAFPYWNEWLAPVFDTAEQLRLLDHENGYIHAERKESLRGLSPLERVKRLVEWHVDALVCGAISRPLQCMLIGHGITVVPFVSGNVDDLVRQWVSEGGFSVLNYAMPGCWRHGQPLWGPFSNYGKEQGFMFGKGGMGGGGKGLGRRGGGGGNRMGGPKAAGPGGICLCPACGYREPHERGIPCNQKKCPKCGAILTRE